MDKDFLKDIIISLKDVAGNINRLSIHGVEQWQLATQSIGVLNNIANAINNEINKTEQGEEE